MILRCKHFPLNLGFRHSQFQRCILKCLQFARSAVFWVVTQKAEPLSLPPAWLRRIGDVPPKRLACSELHGVTTQRTVLFITTTVRTANPAFLIVLFFTLKLNKNRGQNCLVGYVPPHRFTPTLFINATLMENMMG
jgi:hypothetical protein